MVFWETNIETYHLPEELFSEILPRLPAKSVLRFKSVCKSWCTLIKTQDFVKLHLKRSQESNSNEILNLLYDADLQTLNFVNPPNKCRSIELHSPTFLQYYKKCWNELAPPVLVGSCNGLLCFTIPHETYVLYNPSLRVFKELPKVRRTTSCYGTRVFSTLAYDQVNDDYKVFEVFQYYKDYRRDSIVGGESFIFSMKSNSWKTIDANVPFYLSNFAVSNDCLHWVDRKAKVIRSFNLFTETYDEDIRAIPAPMEGTFSRVTEDFVMLNSGACDLVEFVSWESYHYTVLPVGCSRDQGPNGKRPCKGSNLKPMLSWPGLKDGDTVEVPFSELPNERCSLITAKLWVESLVSLY